jgi:hypothetical protein
MPIIPALRRPRQEELKFEASLGLHSETLSQNKQKETDKTKSQKISIQKIFHYF